MNFLSSVREYSERGGQKSLTVPIVDPDDQLPRLDLEPSYGIAPLVAGASRMSRADHEAWLEATLWKPSRVPGLHVADDLDAAAWIAEPLHPGTFEVRMTVPDGFEAYARIFYAFSEVKTRSLGPRWPASTAVSLTP